MRARPYNALLAAAACAVGLLCIHIAAFEIQAASQADLRVYVGFVGMIEPHSKPVNDFVGLVDPLRFALLATAVVAIALARRRFRQAVAVAGVFVGANVTTQALQLLSDAPRPAATHMIISWPSGHMTGAAALALCLVLVVPPRVRPAAAALGGLWMVATAYGIVMLGMHLPSDVLAAMLVAGLWTGLAVAALEASGSGIGLEPRMLARTAAWLAAGLLVAGVAALLTGRLGFAFEYSAGRGTFLAGASLLAAAGVALVAFTGLAGRRSA